MLRILQTTILDIWHTFRGLVLPQSSCGLLPRTRSLVSRTLKCEYSSSSELSSPSSSLTSAPDFSPLGVWISSSTSSPRVERSVDLSTTVSTSSSPDPSESARSTLVAKAALFLEFLLRFLARSLYFASKSGS